MSSTENLKISIVVPMKDEAGSLQELIASIERQTFQPAEIILVDGGSTDKTIELAERFSLKNPKIKLIKTPQASPGKGRDIGIENSANDWIALTDAGISLEANWLENLVNEALKHKDSDIVYGNFAPVTKTFFEKCAAITYVSPLKKNYIRGKFIASSLMKRKVWETVGGFPDLRAAEDLMFMEAIEARGFNIAYAPSAKVYWHLRPDLVSTFRKFVLYSKHNVLAGRQWDWHYGVLKQYILVLLLIFLAVLQSWWWLILPLFWLILRTAKRILAHRYEYGLTPLLNPIYFISIMFIIQIVDVATFVGWIQASLIKKDEHQRTKKVV